MKMSQNYNRNYKN